MNDPNEAPPPFDPAVSDAAPLSADGISRRAAMRESLCTAVVRRRRKRKLVRTAAGTAALSLAAWWGLHSVTVTGTPTPAQETTASSLEHAPSTDAPQAMAHADFAVVQDDGGILARFTASPRPGLDVDALYIRNDEALLQALERAKQPVGILRIEGALQFSAPVMIESDIGE